MVYKRNEEEETSRYYRSFANHGCDFVRYFSNVRNSCNKNFSTTNEVMLFHNKPIVPKYGPLKNQKNKILEELLGRTMLNLI